MNRFWLYYCSILLAIILSAIVLFYGRPVFMPLALAGILALVFMRPSNWFERHHVPRIVTAICSGLIFVGIVVCVILLINWYIHRFAMDWPQLEKRVHDVVGNARQFLKSQWGLHSPKTSPDQPLIGPAAAGKMTTTVLGTVMAVLIHLILIVVYMIMILTMRAHIRDFFVKLVKEENVSRILAVLGSSVKAAQAYIYGMMFVIAYLWVMYSIAFSLIGVHYAIFFAILCGILELIPFVGNLTGSTLTCIMALSQGGGINMVIYILASYSIIQFSQFYIIAPLVMRHQVNLSPLFTIVCLIAGELLWGIPGMIVAIPCLAILKIVCDEVPFLHAFGFLLGRTKPTKRSHY